MGAKWWVYAGIVGTLAMQEANHGSFYHLISSSCSSLASRSCIRHSVWVSHFPLSERGALIPPFVHTLSNVSSLTSSLSFLPPFCFCFLFLCLSNPVPLLLSLSSSLRPPSPFVGPVGGSPGLPE